MSRASFIYTTQVISGDFSFRAGLDRTLYNIIMRCLGEKEISYTLSMLAVRNDFLLYEATNNTS